MNTLATFPLNLEEFKKQALRINAPKSFSSETNFVATDSLLSKEFKEEYRTSVEPQISSTPPSKKEAFQAIQFASPALEADKAARMRLEIINEIVTTERDYVNDLNVLVEVINRLHS